MIILYFFPFLHVTPAFLKRLESCYSVEKGKKIVLRCEVVDPNTQVKWLKNGQEIKPSAKYMLQSITIYTSIIVSSRRTFLASFFHRAKLHERHLLN